jgi:ATP-dependent protease HslVU (ClpYQ) peptidase subunit
MTCIIGLKRDGKVYLGADSLYLDGWNIVRNPNPKIFRVGNMLIGTSGNLRVSDIIQYNLDPDKMHDVGYIPANYIAEEVIPEMRACLTEHGAMSLMPDSAIMVAYRGCLFIIGEDFSLSEIAEYEAIGAGAKYALGYMYAIEDHIGLIGVEQAMENALACAAYFSASVAGPWVVEQAT